MGRPSAEALLISALLVNGDVTEAAQFGISLEHFRGYSQEYAWLQEYYATYAESPSQDDFFHQFPDFPFRSNTNTRYAADEVLADYAFARTQENIAKALESLRSGDLNSAQETLRAYEYRPTSAVPADLVTSLNFLDDFDATTRGLEVAWPTLQKATDGIRAGNVWIWGARLGQGKSAFLCHQAVHTIMTGKRVLYYSLEMTENELRARVHADLATRLGYRDITSMGILRRTVDLREYKQFVNELGDRVPGALHVHTPSDGPVSPSVVAGRAGDYDLVVIDYLTLMSTDAGQHASDDWRTATQISNRIKQVALASGTPVLAAAQINRDGDRDSDLPPRVKNLAQADALGQDADVVVTMRTKPQGVASVLSLEKNRQGPGGIRWWTKFDVNHGVFTEISEEKAEDLCTEAQLAKEMGK